LERSGHTQAAVVHSLTLGSVALLGLVLAYWTWAWFAPRAVPRAAAAVMQSGTLAAASGLFGTVRPEQSATAPTGMAIKLLGVAATNGGRRGYAVVQLGGKEILAVLEGGEVAPGVELAEVHPDHVVLQRGGVRETLAWPRARTPAAPASRTVNKR